MPPPLEAQLHEKVCYELIKVSMDLGSPMANIVAGFQLAMLLAMEHPEWLRGVYQDLKGAPKTGNFDPQRMIAAARVIAEGLVRDYPIQEWMEPNEEESVS